MNKIIAFAFLPFFFSGKFQQRNNTVIPINMVVEAIQVDGPYIFCTSNNYLIKYIFDDNGVKVVRTDSIRSSAKKGYTINVATDEPGKTFPVQLKKENVNQSTDFGRADKQFVISDIEGNFGIFRKLLQANSIIDSNYNWIFGDGHLVLTGDFVDRGDQQTEVLWLIYSLEEQANKAGGWVHFVLGNHEIMNLTGDLRYLNEKYQSNAALIGKSYTALYGEKTELGQWLRTKNIVEKVGKMLYMHGGISSAVNRMNLNLNRLNKTARPFYADKRETYNDDDAEVLFSDLGPFWYRGYYTGEEKASPSQIDKTLSMYKVKHIATGHTVVADTISVFHNGKLINTDVHHAKGHSEGLLIEDGKFYRCSQLGEKFLILE